MLSIALYGLIAFFMYIAVTMLYFELRTRGDNYFSLPLAQRQQIIRQLKFHARIIRPLFELGAKVYRLKTPPLMRYDGVTGPLVMASKKSYAATKNYQPQNNDIFIATQMKCGTTWMQQIVFEVLHRGEGDLSDAGYRHMYALSPWIETSPSSSVPFDRAPLVGKKESRIIKTHMPAQLCPWSEKAKYIYVTRHPVSCFASCLEFIHLLSGPMSPKREDLLSWYCSDEMFWRSWPEHVEGWWRRSQQHENVLFIHYEDMKKDLRASIMAVADFLDTPLSEQELIKIEHKASFDYMKKHEAHFEMFSPNIFTVSEKGGGFIKTGTLDRYKDVADDEAERIMSFCSARLKDAHYPLDKFYPTDSAR